MQKIDASHFTQVQLDTFVQQIRDNLAETNIKIGLNSARSVVAKSFGAKNWKSLSSATSKISDRATNFDLVSESFYTPLLLSKSKNNRSIVFIGTYDVYDGSPDKAKDYAEAMSEFTGFPVKEIESDLSTPDYSYDRTQCLGTHWVVAGFTINNNGKKESVMMNLCDFFHANSYPENLAFLDAYLSSDNYELPKHLLERLLDFYHLVPSLRKLREKSLATNCEIIFDLDGFDIGGLYAEMEREMNGITDW